MYLLSGASTDGSVVERDDDDGSDKNSQIVRRLSAGSYTVEATTFSSATTGNFTLTIQVSSACTVVSLGEIAGTVTQIGSWASDCDSVNRVGKYARFYSFSVTETSDVQIDLESTDSPAVDTYMYLLSGAGTDGSVLEYDDDDGPGLNSQITRELTAGSYTIEATTLLSGTTGNFTVTIQVPTSTTPECTVTSLGAVTATVNRTGTWSSDCMSVNRVGKYAQFYSFSVSGTTNVQIDLESTDDPVVDTYMYLISGAGKDDTVLVFDDDGGDLRNSQIVRSLSAGTYTIEATTYYSARTGDFTLLIVPNPPEFDQTSYTFSVEEDAASGTVAGTVSATDPDGGSVSYSITGGNEAGKFAIAPTSGQISVDGSLDYESTASYSLTVTASDGERGKDTATVAITVTDVFESTISVDIASPVAGQTVTMTASSDAPPSETVEYQWQEGSGTQWVDLDLSGARTEVSYDTATIKTYRVVATYGDSNSAESIPVTIEWRTLTVTVEVDPAAPSSAETVTMTAVTDAPDGISLSYRWEEHSNGSWSPLTSTIATQTTSSPARGTREFKVIVTYGAASPAESSSRYVIWDERGIVTDMIAALTADVVGTTEYSTAETSFLTCVNQGRDADDTYGSFDQVMADYPSTTDTVQECETRAVSPTTMFETIKTVSRQKLAALKTATTTYAAILNTPTGSEFEQSLGTPAMIKQNALQLAAVFSSDQAGTSDGQTEGARSGPDSHGFETCFPSAGATHTLQDKFEALNCLLFDKPHSLWVSLYGSQSKQDALMRDIRRFTWLGYGDWSCSQPLENLVPDPGDGLPCLKHDVAFDSLQLFVPYDSVKGKSETLDAGWNPRNKYLADLMFVVDGICGMTVGDARERVLPGGNTGSWLLRDAFPYQLVGT